MAQRIVAACAGLATDLSPFVTGAQGGLRLADNITIEQPGVAQQRPGFEQDATNAGAPARSMHWYGSAAITAGYDGNLTYAMRSKTGAISGTAQPLDKDVAWVQFAESRRNLYWCAKDGIWKLTASNDVVGQQAGLHEALSCDEVSISTSGTPVAMPNNTARAWRWVHTKRDANGLLVRSAPSPWASFENTTGATVDINWVIPLPTYVEAGDEIELYATETVPSGSTPSDMMYLTKRQVIASADVTAGSVTVKDARADADLGAELYTNPTREGILKANGRPPAAGALAFWNECVWFGRTRGPWTAAIEMVDLDGATAADGSVGFQILTLAGIGTTNGSPVLTGFASTDSIAVGMRVTGTGIPNFPTLVTVISKTAVTVTMSENATATAAVAVSFADGITLSGQGFYASTANFIGPSSGGSFSTFDVVSETRTSAMLNLAYVINMANRVDNEFYAYSFSDPFSPTRAYIVVRSIDLSASQWTATTTRPAALSFEANASGDILVQRDDRPNGLAYSKPDEPEHVPEINFLTVGTESEPIYALVPLRAAMLVFKREGIYRVTGSPPDGWRVDLLEPNVRILHGSCARAMGSAAYVWADGGVFECDEGGARNVSDRAIGETLGSVSARLMGTSTSTAWLSTWSARDLVIVGVPEDTATTSPFVYCPATRAWARWTLSMSCGVETSSDGRFVAQPLKTTWELRRARAAYGTFAGYDASHTISAWTYTSATPSITVTTAQRGEWTPKACDWVSASISGTTYYREITSVALNGSDYVCTLASAFPSNVTSGTAYEGIITRIQWQALTAGSPALDGLYREAQVQIDWSRYTGSIGGSVGKVDIGGQTNIATLARQEWTATRTASFPTENARATWPLELARAAHIYPYVETCDIGLDWRILGITLIFEPSSERGRR